MYLCVVLNGTLRQKVRATRLQRMALRNLRFSDNPLFTAQMYGNYWHAGNPRMLFSYLPSSSGAIAGCAEAARITGRPAKPRALACSLQLQDGLRAALQGQVGRHDSLHVFYQN